MALLIGGVAAVLLELAEPSVRPAWRTIAIFSAIQPRACRTGFAAMMAVYSPRSATEQLIGRVVRLHGTMHGITRAGLPYHANDPRLLSWVHATAGFGFMEAYHQYVRAMSAAQKDAAFAEDEASASLYDASAAPRPLAAWEAMLASTAPQLEGSDTLAEFLQIMSSAPILPAPLRPLQRLLVRAAVQITPQPVRALPQLQGRGLHFVADD